MKKYGKDIFWVFNESNQELDLRSVRWAWLEKHKDIERGYIDGVELN